MKKYVVLTGGDGGYGNLGDEWLLASVRKQYQRHKIYRKYKIVLLMAHPPKNRIADKFIYVRDNIQVFKDSGIKTDEIVAVHYFGGGYINSYWMKEKIWLYDHLVDNGFPKNKFFFTGLGLGPFEQKELNKTKTIAKSAAFFGTRDLVYKKQIKCDFMFDESIVFAPKEFKNRKKNGEIWVNFRIADHVGLKDGGAESIIQTIERFAKTHNLKINYFSMINGVGFNEATEMEKNLLLAGVDAKVFDRSKNPKKLLKRLQNAKMVITTSYHASLAGLYNSVPVVSLYTNDYYDIKFRGLQDVLHTRLLTLVKISSVNEAILESALSSKDTDLTKKLKNLKIINNRAYNKYGEFIHG